MAIVVESSNSNTVASGTSITITKPTGLAVGDLMVANIYSYNTVGGDASINTASGWESTQVSTIAAGADNHSIKTMIKVADSADVAASNFSFTTAQTVKIEGLLMRISGFNSLDAYTVGGNDSDSATNNPAFVYAITPTYNNTLLIAVIAGAQNEVWAEFSAPVISGTNPTWTNQYDGNFEVYTAPYTATSQITSLDVTVGSSPASAGWISTITIIDGRTDASAENTLVTTTSTAFTQSGTADCVASNTFFTTTSQAFTQDGTATSPTQWTNPDKTATPTWSNPNK